MAFVEVPGQIVVYDWSQFKVQIGGIVLNSVMSLRCLRTNTKTIGSCDITVADEYGDLYDNLDYLDEIFIYIQDPDNFYIPNKVWGGWLEDRAYTQGKTHILKITGKEYVSALFDKLYTHTYDVSTNLSIIAKDIVDDDGTLLSSELPATTDKELQVEFNKERHWDALSTITSATGYEFGVNLEQKVYMREIGNAPLSPDTIVLSENVGKVSQKASGENLATNVTTQGKDSTIVSSASASNVEEAYRKREMYVVMPNAGDEATTTEAADTTLNTQKELVKQYTVDTMFLPQTEPNDLIDVTIEGTELNTEYKVISIEHTITNKGSITSRVVLNQEGLDSIDILSNLMKSYSKTQLKTWE